MMMLSKIRQTKLGKFIFAVGCLFPVGIILLFVADEIDLKWIAEWRSLSFEEEKFSFDMDFSFKREAVIEDEKTITLFGTKNEFKSENNKPIVLRTTDGGKNWKRTEIDIDIQSASFDRVGDSVYMVVFVDNNDSVSRPVYVSSGDFEKWEYVGMAESPEIGLYHINKDSSNFFALERENYPIVHLGEHCRSWSRRYAYNDKNWIVCGKNNQYEVRILRKIGNEYRVHSQFVYKWHFGIISDFGLADDLIPSVFYVNENVMAGIFQFRWSTSKWIHYLYYSVDGGKTWQNEKIPVFAFERLAVTEDKIVVLGFDQFYKQKRGEATILTMPIPKN